MKLDVLLNPIEISEAAIKTGISVVIDIFRSSSTIITALSNGCKEIMPVETVERAQELYEKLGDRNALLCGENDGIKPEDFDLGNSPEDYSKESVSGRKIIFTSTNAAKTIPAVRCYERVFIAGFLNAEYVADVLAKAERDIYIVCAGNYRKLSLEDTVCAGMLVNYLSMRREYSKTDAALTAEIIFKNFQDDLSKMFAESEHGRKLQEMGLKKDLEYCIQINKFRILPEYNNGRIIVNN